MTIWKPDLSQRVGPRYLAIADAIADSIDNGQLAAGDKLPPHRDLAFALGVTVGTVTRGYAEAERRGLTLGEVGRGTFIRGADSKRSPTSFCIIQDEETETVDLSLNFPTEGGQAERYARTAAELAADPNVDLLLRYQPAAGNLRHRSAMAALAAGGGLNVPPDRIVVTSGAQHAMTVVFASVCRPGDIVLAEELTYPGILAVARVLNLRLRGVGLDDQGLRPDAFEAACRKGDAKALYCVPTYQNPTSAVMGEPRRAEIAAIAREYGVTVVEDDVYGFLHDNPPKPLATFLPEATYYVSSTSKSMMPALRLGFVVCPEGEADAVAETVRTTTWMANPLAAEVVTRWVADGTADVFSRQHRSESKARLELARRVLDGVPFQSAPGTSHIWLPLPAPWSADDFVGRAAARNIRLISAKPFVVNGMVPQALRICLGSPPTRDDLERGLTVVADLMRSAPDQPFAVV